MFTVRTSFLPFKSYVLNIFVHLALLTIKRKLKKKQIKLLECKSFLLLNCIYSSKNSYDVVLKQ